MKRIVLIVALAAFSAAPAFAIRLGGGSDLNGTSLTGSAAPGLVVLGITLPDGTLIVVD